MPKTRDHITFTEEDHKYVNINTNEEYISVTAFINNFHKKFEGEIIAENLIKTTEKYKNRTVKDILEEWRQVALNGTRMHKILENAVISNFKNIEEEKEIVNNFQNLLKDVLKKEEFIYYPEYLCYNDKYKICGTVDLLLANKTHPSIRIYDYKTNRKEPRLAKDGEMMYDPFSFLTDCSYNHYRIQLSLYYYLLKQEHPNLHLEDIAILWINKGKIKKIDIELIEEEIICNSLETLLSKP